MIRVPADIGGPVKARGPAEAAMRRGEVKRVAANYYLFRTEDPTSENLVEEDNWVAAAEFCDSLGIDVINSSLGYSQFDDPTVNHTYADMNGNTTRCSIAADIAATKGILVVNSAGNSGDKPWHYITAPSDGDSVLCVGAVDANRVHASFSSYGPSSDGDVKPNIVAMGKATVIADLDSTIRTGNGTSFSSPVMAGMAACLIQAFPDKNNMEIFHAIEQSAHLYNNPNDSLGYGIPDMYAAYTILLRDYESIGDLEAQVFPNPCIDHLSIVLQSEDPCAVAYEIYNSIGQVVFRGNSIVSSSTAGVIMLDDEVASLSPGAYFLHLKALHKHALTRFIKLEQL